MTNRRFLTACRDWQFPVLLASMQRHCVPFSLYVLAWDWWPKHRPPPNVTVLSREAFLDHHTELAPERLPGPPRRVVDQVCAARWAFVADVLEATGEPVMLLDGDVWFWSSPEPLFEEIGTAALAVSPHGIPPAAAGLPGVTLETHRRYGLYNAGLTHVADPAIARELAELNRQWSYTEVVERPGRRPLFGDQGHLEDVAERVGAHVIRHPGVNVAPWNLHARPFEVDVDGDGVPLIDGPGGTQGRLIAYHYSSLRRSTDGTITQLADPHYALTTWQERVLYAPYIAAILEDRP